MDLCSAQYCGSVFANGVLIAVTGETADVRACIGNLKVACCEEFLHADVCVCNLSKASVVYSMGQSALALCNVHQFNSRLPRYILLTQGTLSSPLPVEIVCFLLCHLNLVKKNSTWIIMVATQQPDFAAALCVQSIFLVNIDVAYLSEDRAVPEAFVTDLRAGVSNCDSVAPINGDRACDDLEDRFPVDCAGMKYVEQEEKAPSQEEEGVDTQKRPPAKGSGMGWGGTPAQAKKPKPNANGTPTESTPQPSARPASNKAMSAFAAHFTPSQQTQASSGAAATSNPDVDAQQAPQPNAGKGGGKPAKQRVISLRKRRCLVCLLWRVHCTVQLKQKKPGIKMATTPAETTQDKGAGFIWQKFRPICCF